VQATRELQQAPVTLLDFIQYHAPSNRTVSCLGYKVAPEEKASLFQAAGLQRVCDVNYLI